MGQPIWGEELLRYAPIKGIFGNLVYKLSLRNKGWPEVGVCRSRCTKLTMHRDARGMRGDGESRTSLGFRL